MTLQSLIAILEDEKTHLLHLIECAVREEDFKLASYNLKSIRHVDRQLLMLQSLDDPGFEDKNELREIIERMKAIAESDTYATLKEYYYKQIDSYYNTLQALNGIPPASAKDGMQTVLDDCLNNLVEKKIKSFKLVLSKSENLILEFKGIKETVEVKFSGANHLIDNKTISDKHLRKLINLGFKWSPDQEHLLLNLTGNKNEIEEKFRILLMLIVFEVFEFKNFIGETYLEV